jgi:hypothetical protein
MAGDGNRLSDLAPAISELRHSRCSQPRALETFDELTALIRAHPTEKEIRDSYVRVLYYWLLIFEHPGIAR